MREDIVIRSVENDQDIDNVAILANQIWTEHYVPIIGEEQVDYMLYKFQSAETVTKSLLFLEDTAREAGLFAITLTVNKENVGSIKAYERLGFDNIDSVVMDIGNGFVMDDYVLRKSIG